MHVCDVAVLLFCCEVLYGVNSVWWFGISYCDICFRGVGDVCDVWYICVRMCVAVVSFFFVLSLVLVRFGVACI